jgi:Lrp/AsnC family transcriptional regulator, leucine-responsive regulatory protein
MPADADALEFIKSQESGVLQSDLWKALNIDSRKCSRIVAKLMKDNLITRKQESIDGIRTYRLCYADRSKSKRFKSLMPVMMFEPCAGCIEECEPEHCAKLSEWIFSIVIGYEGPVRADDRPEDYGKGS